MKLKNLLTQLATAAALTTTALAAQADIYEFSLTGDYTATWQLNSTVLSDSSADGIGFVLWDVDGFPDAVLNVADVYFWHADIGGGLQIEDYYGDAILVSTDGPQLYTGPEDNPTFLLGTFALTEYQGSGTYSLTVTNLSAIPEPASIALMLGGLGLVGVAAARRRTREETETADAV